MKQLATLQQIESLELEALNARIQWRNMEERCRQAEQEAADERKKRREERAAHIAEMRMVTSGAAVMACLVSAVACVIAAPWWTAIAPLALAWAVLRKAGW